MSANVESRGLIHKGDMTTTGGVVTQGVGNIMFVGFGVSQTGMIATCPSCKKGQGNITPIKAINVIVDGVQAALHGDIVACGCPYGSNTVIASAGAMSFSVKNGVVTGVKPFSSPDEAAAAYHDIASMAGGFTQTSTQQAAQAAYDFTEKEWNEDLLNLAKDYQWDTSEQQNVSLVLLIMEEAKEYYEQLRKDEIGSLGDAKDLYGLTSGLNDAKSLAVELGGLGALAKAVDINGVPHIVIENYKPRYLDLGTTWKKSTAQLLKMGQGMNTLKGNVEFFKGGIFVELAFSGAINAIDYMLHDEKTLGEVVGKFSSDVVQGLVGAAAAQGFTYATVKFVAAIPVIGFAMPTGGVIAIIAISAFLIGKKLSDLDDKYKYKYKYKYSEPMQNKIKELIDENKR